MARMRIEFGEPRRDGFRNRVSGVLIQSAGIEGKNRKALRSQNKRAISVETYMLVILRDTHNSNVSLEVRKKAL